MPIRALGLTLGGDGKRPKPRSITLTGRAEDGSSEGRSGGSLPVAPLSRPAAPQEDDSWWDRAKNWPFVQTAKMRVKLNTFGQAIEVDVPDDQSPDFAAYDVCKRCGSEHASRPRCYEPDDPDVLYRLTGGAIRNDGWDDLPGQESFDQFISRRSSGR